ncbi:metal-dependent hydrolase [Natronomonas halophila]|uniref:metal-dependent hydrolase n=1 Tax=Natronomonas halophila TaxID=2747817 RepID=UPI0015B5AD92|nr:metal-dependent hydrolase [Natronomonas halophila]QLD86420.1 metal-dependent hydrolase [Natronomonas halophila]
MYRLGHAGAALCCYGPVAALLSAGGDPTLAVAGTAIAVACSSLPDVDEVLPIPHRGPTHTVWFVTACSLLAAVIGVVAGARLGGPSTLATVFATATAVSLVSHLLADSITPMGVRPFAPLSDWHHSFDVIPAANRRANVALFGAGAGIALLAQTLALF